MTTAGVVFELSVLETSESKNICQKSGNIWVESCDLSNFLRINRKQRCLDRIQNLLELCQNLILKNSKYFVAYSIKKFPFWKFDWISSGRSTKADVKPAPYLIRAVLVEFYTSRIGILLMVCDNVIESHCIKWIFFSILSC